MKIQHNFSLVNHNTFKMNVSTKEFIEYNDVNDIIDIFAHIENGKFYVLGGGSNTLFTRNFCGTIICPTDKAITVRHQDDDKVVVNVKAGAIWDEFVDWSVENGFYGAENLSHIPGMVGASPVQNIGAYGVEVKDIISNVEFYNISLGRVENYSNEDCQFGYRDSIFKKQLRGNVVVLSVDFTLSKVFTPNLSYGNISEELLDTTNITAKIVRDTIISIRTAKLPDPDVVGNGGSFFKNPIVSVDIADNIKMQYPNMPSYSDVNGVKIPAGWLIEQCGWKGKAVGKAAVHHNQALVLINLGGAGPEEIVSLADSIIKDVKQKFNIEIYPEINFID